jgi:hypothetical protein
VRVTLVFDDLTAYQEIVAEVELTAAIEGGVGAVKLGSPARLSDARYAVAHEFAEVDVDWLAAYINDPRMTIEVEQG